MKPANEAIHPRSVELTSIDYTLLLQRVEKLLVGDVAADEARELLRREAVWKQLPGELALRWARLAQAAGLHDLSLQVLAWVNETTPQYIPAWQERVELLRTLGRGREAGELPGPLKGTSSPEGGAEARKQEANPRAAQGGPHPDDIEAPFHSMRREEEMLTNYLTLFQGREDCFARQWSDRQAGTQGYVPVRRPMEIADVRDHISGHRTYGIYLLQRDSRTRLGVIDADLAARFRSGVIKAQERDQLRREKAYLIQRILELSREGGLPCLTEFSGGKGFHFWYFFSAPVPALWVRQALQAIAKRVGSDLSCFGLEVFPKQDQLAGKGLGNLVKLPLGVHRVTGKASFFPLVSDRSREGQLAALEKVKRISVQAGQKPAMPEGGAEVVVHPRHQAWAEEYPELALLFDKCPALGQIAASCRQSKTLSVREEKILFGTIGFLPRAKTLMHHLFQCLPEYNPHLVDYNLSRLRGTVLGCKRIHSLLNLTMDLCVFSRTAPYPHPLLHWPQWSDERSTSRAERVTNLGDAIENLRQAIGTVERFLLPKQEG